MTNVPTPQRGLTDTAGPPTDGAIGESPPPPAETAREPRRRRGGAERGRRTLALVLLTTLALAVAALALGRNFVSPAQQAADAAPPKASVITARVAYGPLAATVVLRASAAEANPVAVTAPTDLDGSLPVVTASHIRRGSKVRNGDELLTVAERPVFAFAGRIPAFRTMRPATTGVDVVELQAGLRAAGYSTGTDQKGHYGVGTEGAVRRRYAAAAAKVALTSPDADKTLARLAAAVSSARKTLTRARDTLAEDTEADATDKPPADRAAISAAEARVHRAERALHSGRQTMGAVVPRGEVVFVPRLPQRVVSPAVHAGSTARGTVAEIGSGRVRLSGAVDASTQSQLRVGMPAKAVEDVSGKSFPLRMSKVAATPDTRGQSGAPQYAVAFAPTGKLPAGVVGHSVAVTITTAASSAKVFSVPVAAINTGSSGDTYITVVGDRGRRREIRVRLGLSAAGAQAVTPLGGALYAGEPVIVGARA
jgi:HlyD family secretion protein